MKLQRSYILCLAVIICSAVLISCGKSSSLTRENSIYDIEIMQDDEKFEIMQDDKNKEEIFIKKKQNEEWEYLVYSNHISITEYLGNEDIIIIPEKIDGIRVTEIGYKSIGIPVIYNTDVKEIVIPEGVTTIGDFAFDECINLEQISIPESVNYIGYKALDATKWFYELEDEFVIAGNHVLIKYNGTDKKMNIPNGIKYIAPLSAHMLEKGNIPETIIIPNSVVGIEKCAFSIKIGSKIPQDFEKIKNIEIPDSVKRIGNDAFLLTSWYKNQNERFVVVGDGILIGCNFDKEEMDVIDIPEDIKYISSMSSINGVTDKVNTINIPKKVKGIEWQAFDFKLSQMDYEINQINVYGNSVMDGSFMYAKVKNINFIDELNQVRDFMFCGAYELEEAEFMDSVTNIGISAFWDCEALKNIEINENVPYIGDGMFQSCIGLESITIPSNTRYIGDGAFSNCKNLKTLIIENGVVYIGKNAFRGCESLYGVAIPPSVTDIGEGAFECNIIYGTGGSAAEKYAKENGINFFEVEENYDFSNNITINKSNNDVKDSSLETNQNINTDKKSISEDEAKEMANQYWDYHGEEGYAILYDGIKESNEEFFYAFRYRWYVSEGGNWSTIDFLYINTETGETKYYIN